jgi:5-methylcytosine-specific restriction protein B
LLQEYFYGDYGKIGLVLGEDFVRQKPSTKKFAAINGYESGDYDRVIFEIITEKEMKIENAIKTLLHDSE